MAKRDTHTAQDRRKNEAERKRLDAEAAAAEKERIRLEEIEIQKQIEAGVFKGAKGGILKMRKGGKPAAKPKKPKHSTMLEGERPMPITSQPFFTERFDPSKSKRQNKTSKKSAPTPMRNGGKIDGCATRGKTKGRYV